MNPFAVRSAWAKALALDPAPKPRRAKVRAAKPLCQPAPVDDLALPAGRRVICRWPPITANPNSRAHWSKKNGPAQSYKRECWGLALEAFGAPAAGKLALPAEGRIRLQLDFFPPDRRRRDDDNAEASFKAGRDGIALALGVDDSRFAVTKVWHPVDDGEPRACVVVTILAARA